jgi:hypothetical protein
MCPLRRALTMAQRVQRTAEAEGWASWSGHEIGDHSPKVTLVEPGSMGLRWWMAVVDRGVVVCDEWGLVVASANIGEGGFCRMRLLPLPSSIGTRLACAVTLLSFTFILFLCHQHNQLQLYHTPALGSHLTCRSRFNTIAVSPHQLFGRESAHP